MTRTGLVLLLAAIALPATAQEELRRSQTWAFFVDRCLLPVENVLPPITDALVPQGTSLREEASDLVLTVTEDRCEVAGGDPTDLAALLDGREEYVDQGGGIWQSTTWREPRIEVEATETGYAVTITDLES